MAWDKAELLEVTKQDAMVRARYRLTNGATSEAIEDATVGDNLDADTLAAFLKRRLAVLNGRDSAFGSHSPGQISIPSDPPPGVNLFFAKKEQLRRLRVLADLKIIAPDAQALLDAEADIKAHFDNATAGIRALILVDPRFG